MRKLLTAGLVAGMIAIGAASASSLGDFDDVTLAVGSVELVDCTAEAVEVTTLHQLQPAGHPFQGVLVDTIEVSGFDESCIGSALTWRLHAEDGRTLIDATGTAARILDGVEITGTDMSFPVYNAFWAPAEELYGITLIVR